MEGGDAVKTGERPHDFVGIFSRLAANEGISCGGVLRSIYSAAMDYQTGIKKLAHRDASPRHDFWLATLAVLLVYALAWWWNLAEQASALTQQFEFIQLDELPLALFAAAVASAWFSRRRMRDLLTEVTCRREAEQALAQLLAENRALAQHAQQVQETERRRMAREIHDDMGQYLTAIRLGAAALFRSEDPMVVEHTSRIASHAEHMQTTVKALLHHLRPVALDEYGLPDAIRHLVHEWTKIHPDLACDLMLDPACANLPDHLNNVAYRMVQEALTNIGKHAHATRVEVEIRLDDDTLLIDISDNGVGFNHPPKRGCFGLVGMRERVETVQGIFHLNSQPNAGVHVSAQIPLQMEV